MKQKSVKCVITETAGRALVYNVETKQVFEDDFTLKMSFKTTEGLEKGVRDYYKDLGLSLVDIIESKKEKVTYEVDMKTFMSFAVEIERA